jgi:hypothetical protein
LPLKAIGGINALGGQRDRVTKAQSHFTLCVVSALCLCAFASLCLHRRAKSKLKSSSEEKGSPPITQGGQQKALQDLENRIKPLSLQKSTDKISYFKILSHPNNNIQDRRIP